MITDKFKSIAGYEKVFAQNEAESSWVKTELVSYLSQYYNARYTSDQYCFMMLFYRHIGSITLDTVSRRFIDSSNTQIFKEILEKCFKLKVGEILRSFINDPNISYSFGRWLEDTLTAMIIHFQQNEYSLLLRSGLILTKKSRS